MRGDQAVDERAGKETVGARPDADPFIGDRRIAGAHRIDGDEFGTALLELAETHLDRIGGMIFRNAEQQKILGVLPVGLAEFPERAAEGVEPGSRHVDRAEAAMRGIIGRAELRRPPAGQRLRLVAAGEEGKLARIGVAHLRQPHGGGAQGFFPFDLAEFAGAALADPDQRLRQAGPANNAA